jgi:urease accessory protein UreF
MSPIEERFFKCGILCLRSLTNCVRCVRITWLFSHLSLAQVVKKADVPDKEDIDALLEEVRSTREENEEEIKIGETAVKLHSFHLVTCTPSPDTCCTCPQPFPLLICRSAFCSKLPTPT